LGGRKKRGNNKEKERFGEIRVSKFFDGYLVFIMSFLGFFHVKKIIMLTF
jgi:hypothetical protein